MRPLLLLLAVLALPARAEIADYGSFTYELYQQMQENHGVQPPPPLTPVQTPIFHCAATRKGLSCRDDQQRRYRCADHGAAGQYCQREDGHAWIHCFRRLLGHYKCTVISSQRP